MKGDGETRMRAHYERARGVTPYLQYYIFSPLYSQDAPKFHFQKFEFFAGECTLLGYLDFVLAAEQFRGSTCWELLVQINT